MELNKGKTVIRRLEIEGTLSLLSHIQVPVEQGTHKWVKIH